MGFLFLPLHILSVTSNTGGFISSAYIFYFFFVSFYDPGPHGNFRYSRNMLPEVRESDFRKGSQVTLPYYLVKLSLSVKYVPSVVQDAPYFQQNLIYSQSHS
jgi:hypothetical protein